MTRIISPSAVFILLLGCLFMLPSISTAQAQRFKAGVMLGFNASQIDGDELWGYNKAGLSLGARFLAIITPRIDLSMDMLYSQRGSQSQFSLDNSQLLNRYNLHYVEVPIILHFKDWIGVTTEDEQFYRVEANAGLAYSRLIRARMSGNAFEGREDLLNQNDFSWLIGIGYHASPNHSFHVRYTDSINKLFDDQEALNTRNLRGYFLTLHYIYTF
jgi:hypothetical protein